MLTYFLATLAVLIVVFLIAVSRQPDTFRVERSMTMGMPASSPFAQVNEFHNWKSWSPYVELGPAKVKPVIDNQPRPLNSLPCHAQAQPRTPQTGYPIFGVVHHAEDGASRKV
jgi:hypothetical protein